jgi:LPXTG-motif cell wall-anchored protein
MLKFLRSLPAVSLALSLGTLAGTALAGPHEHKPDRPVRVPEINGTIAGAGLALVLGGAAVVLGRRRRKAG